MQSFESCLIDVTNAALDSGVPDEVLADAITSQASLLAHRDPEEIWQLRSERAPVWTTRTL